MVPFGIKNGQNQAKNLDNKTDFCANYTLALSGLFDPKWFRPNCTTGVIN